MNETLTAATVTGALLPVVIAVAQQWHWSKAERALAALVVSVVAGLVVAAVNGVTTVQETVMIIVSTVIATQATHQGVWKPIGVAGVVETYTSPTVPNDGGDDA